MQAVIFIGAQASGKSTFFKERFFDTHVRINLDMLRTRHREKVLLDACLAAKQSFVVDNTNPTPADRQRYIVPAKQAGFEVVGYFFEAKIEALLQRNRQREGSQRIPVGGVWRTYNVLQTPTFAEGFDKLYFVRVGAHGQFEVEEQLDEA